MSYQLGPISISGSVITITGSIATTQTSETTASWANNAVTASYALFAANGGGSINTSSFVTTGSNTFIGNQIISGALAIGTSSLGSTENTLVVGPPGGGVGEGGQILLQASGGLYTSASMIDTYQNTFRILRGTNAGSNASLFNLDLHTNAITTAGTVNGATSTEIGYLSGSTSNLQTQLNGRLTNDATVLGYQGLGSSIKGYPLGINLTAVGASTGFTNQRLWLTPVYVPADSVITGVRWLQIAAGGYTANNYNGVGVYTVSGGTINIAVSSSNNGNIWKTFSANTWGSQSFDAPYSASKGSYFIGALLNATTTPSPLS